MLLRLFLVIRHRPSPLNLEVENSIMISETCLVIYATELEKEQIMNNPQPISKIRLTLNQDELAARVADSLKRDDRSAAVETWRQLIKSLGGMSESDINTLIQQTIQKTGLGADVATTASPEALESKIKELEEKLNTIGDDAQLANVDLQNILEKQQQMLQALSTISKLLYDTAMTVIRKIGG